MTKYKEKMKAKVAVLEVRKLIAAKLKAEFDKRNYSSSDVSSKCDIEQGIIDKYLNGENELKISELLNICNCINFNFVYLLKPVHKSSLVSFRNVDQGSMDYALSLENIFHIIKDYVPDIKTPKVHPVDKYPTDWIELISIANKYVSDVKREYDNSLTWACTMLNITFVSNKVDNDIDGFYLTDGFKSIIYVNTNFPPCRIRFTIAHELSHLLFDKRATICPDSMKFNPYSKKVTEQNVSEFVATKFAQFMLIPFEKAERWAKSWPNINLDDVQQTIFDNKTSVDVAVNAIYDLLYIIGKDGNYKDIKEELSELYSSYDDSILEFVSRSKERFFDVIKKHRDDFSDQVYERIVSEMEL